MTLSPNIVTAIYKTFKQNIQINNLFFSLLRCNDGLLIGLSTELPSYQKELNFLRFYCLMHEIFSGFPERTEYGNVHRPLRVNDVFKLL
jgi:hypothetical protein